MPFFATQKLGPKQSVTPDGYLLCEAVPIARTGEQLYGPDELPLEPGTDLLIRVNRAPEDVFRPETMASFEGKPVTMGHPDEFVSPDNWNELAVGHAQNVRRGDGLDADLVVADLLITNADAIAEVRAGLRETSCGYEADYEESGKGNYYQRNIIGNHIALVPDGRAGIRCSIQDEGTAIMKTKDHAGKKPLGLIGRLMIGRLILALKANDEDGLMSTLESMDEEETDEEKKEREAKEAAKAKTGDAASVQAQLATLQKTVDSLAKTVKKLTKDGLGIEEVKTGDEEETEEEKKEREAKEAGEKTKTGDALRDASVKAEILCPGFSMPTKDSVIDIGAVVGLQRRVLGETMKTEDGKAIVSPLLAGRTLDKLGDESVTVIFNAAAAMMGKANSSRGQRTNVNTKDFGNAPPTAAEQNVRNAEFWAKRS